MLIKNDKKCNDIYMTWGHMVGGPQNTVTPIPLSPKTKTSIPNKQTSLHRNVTGRKNRSRQPSQKQATPHPTPSIRTRRVTQINFEEFLEGSLRLNGAAKYLGFCRRTGRCSSSLVVGRWPFFFGVAVGSFVLFSFGREPGW